MAKIADIIKYEGDNSTFIWKHPCEDFNALTQLIVHESQEAVFFMNGEALDVFRAGRYTLESQNIPLVGKALNRATGGETPFHCEVYFINKTVQMDLKWGTDSKVRYLEPEYGIPVEIGASGSLNLKVEDSLKLLVKLVGTMNGIAWDGSGEDFTKSLRESFRPMISTAVKSNLSAAIKENGINVLEVDEHLTELSATLKAKIEPGFGEYGLAVPHFYLTTVVLPEDDPNFAQLRALHTVALKTGMAAAEAQVTAARREAELERQTTQTEVAKREAERQVIAAQAQAEATRQAGFAEAQVMQAQGITKKDYVQAEVQKAYAEGIGKMGSGSGGSGGAGGSTMSDIIGLGVGLPAAQALSGQINGIFGNLGAPAPDKAAGPEMRKCPKCGADIPAQSKFCLVCGEKVGTAPEDTVVCPGCGNRVPKGKFCIECGATLSTGERKCPKCGADVPAGGKFCLECGEKQE